MLRNSEHAWGLVARIFHWLLAILIVGQLVLGFVAEGARVSPQKLELFVWHKSIGISILFIVVLRVAWRWKNKPPVALAGVAVWEKRLAKAGHSLLYVLMVAVPLSGWWISDTSKIPFKLFWLVGVPDLMEANREMSEIAAQLHEVLTTLLIIVIGVHISAALRHHFVLRNDTLMRMLRSPRDPMV